MDPLVSIIVITYNSAKYINETLESVKAQTYNSIELILSDDCSTDNTVELSEKWISANSNRFANTRILTTQINTGIPANCNRGIKEASGTWIKILAGDDLLLPDALSELINYANQNHQEDVLALHGRVTTDFEGPAVNLNIWGNPSQQNFNRKTTRSDEQFKILLRFCPVSAPTVLIKKNVFETVGLFDERFKFWEDRPMWLKMTAAGI
jgi:glycosyltransferase involved in cell wall biosynthesis